MSAEHDGARPTRAFDRDFIVEVADRYSADFLKYLENEFKLSPADAEELVADLFGDLFARHADGRPAQIGVDDDPRHYLFGLLRNNAVNRKTWRKRHPLVAEPEKFNELARGPLSTIVGKEQLEVALAALKDLPEQDLRLLTLVDQEGLELWDAARQLKLNRKTASTMYNRAHRKLRVALGQHWSTYIVPAGSDSYKPRTRDAVAEHVMELPKDYREILLERHLAGVDEVAAARKLGLSAAAFAERLAAAESHLETKTGLSMAEILAILAREPQS